MEVTLTADLRQAVDWLGTGKFAVGMPIQGGTVYKAKNQGLPVDEFKSPYHFKEGVNLSSAFGSLALMNRAPHPNAAKVFINWLLSREGQTLFQKVMLHARRCAKLPQSRMFPRIISRPTNSAATK